MSLIIKAEAVIPKGKRQHVQEYHWTEIGPDKYELTLPTGYAKLSKIEESGQVLWEMILKLEDDFIGTRSTLEEAFQTLDKMIYCRAKEYWLKMRCGVVLEKFSGIDNLGELV